MALGLQLYSKKTLVQVLSSQICEISKSTFFTGQLWTTVSDVNISWQKRTPFLRISAGGCFWLIQNIAKSFKSIYFEEHTRLLLKMSS